MAIENAVQHGVAEPDGSLLSPLDASKVIITLTDSLKPIPAPENMIFGQNSTDHLLISTFHPATGWSAPEIKPYAPLSLDPMCSCFQYSTNVFEGMKAYLGPNGEARLFRPEKNMERLSGSAARLALPPFDPDALLTLIKKFVLIEKRWIPTLEGYSLYARPTIIGTRPVLGVAASDHAILYVVLSPTGPYFRTGPRSISLLAVNENVRSWPGGTGGHKLGLNYAPCFLPQRNAAKLGYEQVLWLLGDKITEAGAMNFFVVVRRDDGDLDVITPPLDGTILPGLTRASCLELTAAHPSRIVLPNLPASLRLHTHERPITMGDLVTWSAEGRLLEAFAVGTAVLVAGVGRIGYEGKDLVLPDSGSGLGPFGKALYDRIVAIQEGRFEWEGWSVVCE